MRIKIILPNSTIDNEEVEKITAPGTQGNFQILPKHIDVIWTLRPGILIITTKEKEYYYAINRGVLVKKGEIVYISTFQAVMGDSLEKLKNTVTEKFDTLDDTEKKAREVLVRLETDTLRRFMEIDM